MKTNRNIALSICMLAGLILSIGCGGPDQGGPIAPVAGVVTLDGTPLPNVEVIFSPIGVDGNANPGPYSVATTDPQGKFELKTRYDDVGAVIAKHAVTFQYPDIEAGAMDELEAELADAKRAAKVKDEESPAGEAANAAVEVQAQIDAMKTKLKGRRLIPSSAAREIDVPKGGLPDLKIELVSKN